jgi:hypothetical protein
MAADESALVAVAPDDTVDSILKKIRGTRAKSVQLLVPDDTGALQAPRGFERLRRALDAEGVALLVISSDDQTLDAARRNRIETVEVDGARVRPDAPGMQDKPRRYTTQVLPTAPLDARDAEFLDALDQMPAGERYADLQDEDAELYAALDDLPEPARADTHDRRAAAGSDDDFASELDAWSDMHDDQTVAARSPLRGEGMRDTAARRYSAADMDLTDDDVLRQRPSRRTAAGRPRSELRADTARGTAGRRQGTTARRQYEEDEGPYAAPRRPLAWLLPLAIVALLALGAAFWLVSNRVTVVVSPPAAVVSQHPFNNEVIPLAEGGSAASASAVQAAPVTADAEATVGGQVTQERVAPTGTAKGAVTVINTIGQAITIPKGSEFIGKNQAGQEVRFLVDGDVTVPGATTTSSLSGSSTTYGQASVNVTARSPGAASNVPQNSITTLLIPGQQPLVNQNSNFIFQNDAIGGGSEAPQRVVTEADVEGVLPQALTQLYDNGQRQLSAQIDSSKAAIDPQTIAPSPGELGSPENYQVIAIEPAIGSTVEPASPTFTVTVRARFSALATPEGKPVQAQLGEVVKNYFQQRATQSCKAGENPSQVVTAWRWDGQKLAIDGVLNCTPTNALSAETIARVKDALAGQSRDAAEASLITLQQQGLIGGYQLPAGRSSFPNFDWLITVEVGQPPPAEPQPTGAPQPTQSAP